MTSEPDLRSLARVEYGDDRRRILVVPGFVSAHSHAFQFDLRGKTQRRRAISGDFWSWREEMYALAERLSPESLADVARRAFRQLVRAGVVEVGEFHYVHHQRGGRPYDQRTLLADVMIEAALAEGLRITLLRVAYARAGAGRPPEGPQLRFCDDDVDDVLRDVDALSSRWRNEPRVRIGIAPHSVRAVPFEWLTRIAAFAREKSVMPVHMHVAEQSAEIDECIKEHGKRPVELISDAGLLETRFCAVHATLITQREAALLGRARAFACICPTTERDLGDGLADIAEMRESGIRICVGIDSHVVTDHIEEIRALETHERLRTKARVTFEPTGGRSLAEQLLLEGSAWGAASLGHAVTVEGARTDWRSSTHIAVDEDALGHVSDDLLADAVVFSSSALRASTNP